MAAFEILVPPLEGYEQQAAAFAIEPEELAVLGLSMVGRVPDKYTKTCDYNSDYGFVMPHVRGGQHYFLRGIYLHESELIDPLGIPRHPEELGAHLLWHQNELIRLQRQGLAAAKHLPVIVKDEDRWGEAGYGIFTLAESVPGESLEESIKRRSGGRQKAAMEALGKIFNYYVDPDRPPEPIMRDICYMRQYNGQCLVDLDPLPHNAEFPNELAHLSSESRRLRSREGKALHERIYTEWLRQLDEAINS